MSNTLHHRDSATGGLAADPATDPAAELAAELAADMAIDVAARVLAPPPPRHAALLATLDAWVAQGWLRALDRVFAGFLARQAPDADELLILAAALASHQLGRGHACLDLAATLADAALALALPPDDRAERAPSGADDDREDSATDSAPVAPSPARLLADVDLPRWLATLAHPLLVAAGPGATPLVREGQRLYLRRYWQHEQDVRAAIAQRLAAPTEAARPERLAELRRAIEVVFTPADGDPGAAASAATPTATPTVTPTVTPDWQRLACALAARQGFAIVTGGPGTGKTTTVVRLLAVLQHLALGVPAADGGAPRPLRIRLAAPTGKAAARLNESIAKAVGGLNLAGLGPPRHDHSHSHGHGHGQGDAEALRAAIPTAVSTVHRLLGSRPDTRHFRHDARHPLPLDVLVIDEASMLDLEMMAAVLAALPPQARLVLLGDKDQLASVEAGAVLGDLCRRADDGHYLPDTAAWLQAATGQAIEDKLIDAQGHALDQAVARLRHSHRFSAGSGIGRLAEAVNRGDADGVRQVLAERPADLACLPAGDEAAFRALVVHGAPAAFGQTATPAAPIAGYARFLRLMQAQQPPADAPAGAFDDWARAVLAAQAGFQLLCALRSGPQGVAGLNARIVALLRDEGLLPPAAMAQPGVPGAAGAPGAGGEWYAGRPVLVTRNDYGLGLMNGDVGVTLARPDAAGGRPRLRVAFAAGDGSGAIRWVLPSRLRAVETVFAMTVHKSQGSEFAHAALVLPARLSPVLTRELVYTGITRARQWFTLVPAVPAGPVDVLRAAVQRRVERVSGLVD
ncbi:exodeoxyribonuclease V subunit alpha [Aquabacterium sp. OR-4]|uniref:exodeoxyribonuclease V subunit alpha n=1 Tax=Aquabacterium sp. OR-4 TaxID=2978127 RepID=UPI0028C8616E|nr:exodeoxyribonuclease V subunit alpha [Aquabacterium sp. OR-4]MDT7833652.1 exodeoxyribonuclease V subunit alpha [Aquabacterium sp. OR-4]